MDWNYSPANPIIWGLFAAFVVFLYLIVRVFLSRNPGYPGDPRQREE